jgi:sugar lactone lactonase YvrE
LFGQSPAPRTYTIYTFAGNGSAGFSGDGGAADAAQVNNPWGLVFDSSGNLYIADQMNQRIRKVAPGGTISLVGGDGTASFGGDGSAATSAKFNYPTGLAVSSSGTLYFADTVNHRVRSISSSGTVAAFAGTGEAGSTGDDAAATEALLNYPTAVAVESSGRVLIADTYGHRIRAVATDGKITSIVGTGTAGFAGDGDAATSAKLRYPQGLVLDSEGRIYISDTFNHRIRRVDTDGTISTIAGNGVAGFSGDGGPATKASLFYPKGLAFDSDGNLIIADCFNGRVRVVTPGGEIRTIAGNGLFGDRGDWGPAAKAWFRFPSAVAVDAAGNIYVADTQNNRVRILRPDPLPGDGGEIPTEAGEEIVTNPEN